MHNLAGTIQPWLLVWWSAVCGCASVECYLSVGHNNNVQAECDLQWSWVWVAQLADPFPPLQAVWLGKLDTHAQAA